MGTPRLDATRVPVGRTVRGVGAVGVRTASTKAAHTPKRQPSAPEGFIRTSVVCLVAVPSQDKHTEAQTSPANLLGPMVMRSVATYSPT